MQPAPLNANASEAVAAVGIFFWVFVIMALLIVSVRFFATV